jgi:adenylosuccinate synthase
MPSVCVFGAQWGDEGKGKIIDSMARDADVVVRYQGGANAGHTVVAGGKKYVLHLVPSGILHPSKLNVIGSGVAVDPLALWKEISELRAAGVAVDGSNLRLSAGAHVIFGRPTPTAPRAPACACATCWIPRACASACRPRWRRRTPR